jgi:hypothetical protein
LTFFTGVFATGFLRAFFLFALLETLVRRVFPARLAEDFPDFSLELLPFRVAMSARKENGKRALANESSNLRQALGVTPNSLF